MKKNNITRVYVRHNHWNQLYIVFDRGEKSRTYFPKSAYNLLRIERLLNTRPFKFAVYSNCLTAFLQMESNDE